jgi:hypothetical protein
MSVPTGTIVAYATAPGSTAEDGTGTHGTYTAALARYLATPGLDIKEVFDRTAQEVERVTNGRQRPREEIGLRGRFVLREGAGAPALASVTPTLLPQGQTGGINLSDLEREQQARQAWAQWQQRMQADFDRISAFQGEAGLRLQAWQRFLDTWKDDNPVSFEDEGLRALAKQAVGRLTQQAQSTSGIHDLRLQPSLPSTETHSSSPSVVMSQSIPLRPPATLLTDESSLSSPTVDSSVADPAVGSLRLGLYSNSESMLREMLGEAIRLVEERPHTEFRKFGGVLPEPRDKADTIAKLRALPIRGLRFYAYSLFSIFANGVVYPACKRGASIDVNCIDFDRKLMIPPDYRRALILAEYLSQDFGSTATLGKLYENGWGVSADLPKAWILYRADKGEYGWTDANRLIQRILVSLGESLRIDGDFGLSSCASLRKYVKSANCSSIDIGTVRTLVQMSSRK